MDTTTEIRYIGKKRGNVYTKEDAQTPAMVESPAAASFSILSHAACPRSRIALISRSFGHTPTASTGIASSVDIRRSSSCGWAKNSRGLTDMYAEPSTRPSGTSSASPK